MRGGLPQKQALSFAKGHTGFGTFAMLIMDDLGHLGAITTVVEDVAVDPVYPDQGIGMAMMRHAMALAADAFSKSLRCLPTSHPKKAQAFYDSSDFEHSGFSLCMALRSAQE